MSQLTNAATHTPVPTPEHQASLYADRRRWTVVGLLFTAALINYLDRATIGIALPAISRDLHLSALAKGTLLSSFFWSYTLMQVPAGYFIDRLNARTVFAVQFAVWSVACACAGLARTLETFIIARIVLGIGESVYIPGATTMIGRLFAPSERGVPCGWFNSGARMGLVIGGPAIGWLIVRYGWRHMFLLVGTTGLLWLIPWLTLFPQALATADYRRTESGVSDGISTHRLILNRNLIGICIGFFCLDYYAFLLLTWLPDYLVHVRHLTLFRAGALIAIPYLLFGICEPLGGWISDQLIRRGHRETATRKIVIAGAFAAGALLIPAILVHNEYVAFALIAGSSLVGLSTANTTVVIQSCAPPSQLGLWTGIENTAGNLGGILAPLLMGMLVTQSGSYFPGFFLACVMLLVGAAAYLFIVGDLKPELLVSG